MREKLTHLHAFLKSIQHLSKEIGIKTYQIKTDDIVDFFKEKGIEISLPTIYRYVRNLSSEGYIQITSKHVKTFIIGNVRVVDEQMKPNIYVVDSNTNEVPPNELPSNILMEQGEKKLTFYTLTEKGEKILEENENE
jgi:predicted transcriptional regulator